MTRLVEEDEGYTTMAKNAGIDQKGPPLVINQLCWSRFRLKSFHRISNPNVYLEDVRKDP